MSEITNQAKLALNTAAAVLTRQSRVAAEFCASTAALKREIETQSELLARVEAGLQRSADNLERQRKRNAFLTSELERIHDAPGAPSLPELLKLRAEYIAGMDRH